MANPYDEQILGAEQQRAYAQKLRESANQPQGQMVSGYYVAPAATQNLAELAKTLTGAFMENRANQNIKDIQAQKQKAIADALKGYQATQGTKTELTSDLTNMSPAAQQFAQPTQQVQYTPQEQDAAFANLYQQDPQAAQMAMALRQVRQSEADKQAAAAEARRQFEVNKDLQRAQMEQQWKLANLQLLQQKELAQQKQQPTAQDLQAQQQKKENDTLTAQQAIDQANALLTHPGRENATGASSWMSMIPGTDAKGFQAQLDTFKAQTFLPMVAAMKGMGALSDAEGKKLSAAVGALDPSMPEAEFKKSLEGVIGTLYNKAKASGLSVVNPLEAKTQVAGIPQGWSVEAH